MSGLILIDSELWTRTRAGARSGRGFRYQDAVAALLAVKAWSADAPWNAVVPEGIDDITLHGRGYEVRAQLKARHDPRGKFSLSEVASYIAKAARDLPLNWELDNQIHLAIVLERPVEGLEATGWRESLSGHSFGVLRDALLNNLRVSQVIAESILARTSVVIEQNPLESALPILEEKTTLSFGVSRLILQRLREVAGCAADKNYLATASNPASLGANDVQEIIDSVSGLIDPHKVLSLTEGLCEVVSFSPLDISADFYSGVNVQPGHVAAGSVFERPDLTAEILAGLESKQSALVVGPSGSGKSALAWLAAFHTRHAVRWYRIRQFGPENVGRLIQFVRLQDVSLGRPVGFVVDDVGRESSSGWDALVREAPALPGLLLLGTVREEDVFLLSTAASVPTIRPLLDEDLAQRVWQALSKNGGAKFGHWREPFELSRGLLLEYTHLLTEGVRLAETIKEQVRRRLAEGRDDELLILGPVAFAAARGASICQSRLRAHLGWETPRFARALIRLVNEHAVRQQSNGTLAGLHEIRSGYLDDALRESIGDDLNVSISETVHVLSPGEFAIFVLRTLRRWPHLRPELNKALAQRANEGELSCLAPILHGLGLATLDLVAERWLEISREIGIDDRLSAFCLGMAISIKDLADIQLFAKVKQAQTKMTAIAVGDLRCEFLASLSLPDTSNELNLNEYHELLATLLPLSICEDSPELGMSVSLSGELPLIPLLETVRTAIQIGGTHAEHLINEAGGPIVLLERLYHELSWVTRPVTFEEEGKLCIAGDVRMISDRIQPDIHADVVRYCELLLAAVPSARIVVSKAIFPNGRPVGIEDFEVATKRIERENLPPPVSVAWHRAQLRAVQRLVGAPKETTRAINLVNAISELSTKLKEAAEYFCRMEVPNPKWRALVQIRGLLNDFVQPPSVDESVPNALAQGAYAGTDDTHTFVDGVQRLVIELIDGEADKLRLMAWRVADLAKSVDVLAVQRVWRMAPSSPEGTLRDMQEILWDLCDVLCEFSYAPARRRSAAIRYGNSSRKYLVLRRVAQEAREREIQDSITQQRLFEGVFNKAGLQAEVYTRQGGDRGKQWPNVEYAVLLVADSITSWFQLLELFQQVMQSLPDSPRFVCASLIEGCIPPIAVSFIQRILPEPKFASAWSASLPYPIIVDGVLDQFSSAIEALAELSAIYGDKGRSLNEDEEAWATRAITEFASYAESFSAQKNLHSDECLVEVGGYLYRCYERVKKEIENGAEGQTLAMDFSSWASGAMTESCGEMVLCRVLLMERAIRIHRSQVNADL